jgi:2-amino-4-hydroxy-6-hydroxymethyldihydropteridine diphosphokinase
MEKTVYLSLGSNLGDRARKLEAAIERLRSIGEVDAVSSFYETEPVGNLHQPWFLNCAVRLRTEKMPRQLLAAVMAIEQALGRKRSVAKGARTIDIDILLFGRFVVNVPSLTIPHPAMHQRCFVLEPLAEIAPAVRHPVFRRTIHELLDDLPPGPPQVRKLDEGSA